VQLLVGLLWTLPILTLVISLHELGHLLVAKHFGFKIQEYFVGFGPRLWSTRRGEIEYGVKAFLIGGYVKIAGMNPYETVAAEDLPRSYGAKPIWQRALVIFAGPGSHFVIGAVFFALWLGLSGNPSTGVPGVEAVAQQINGHVSPASAAGLRPGDVIVGVGPISRPTGEELSTYLEAHVGHPVIFTIERGSATLHLTMTPELSNVGGTQIARVGIRTGLTDIQRSGPLAAIVGGVRFTGTAVAGSIGQIGHVFGPSGMSRVWHLLFSNAPRRPTDATSLVGIGQQVGAVSQAGDYGLLLYVAGFITVFIGLLNLIPLPPFDGGHLLLLAIEKVRGKTIDFRKVIPVSVLVMGFFVVFVLSTMFLDITKPLPGP